MVSPVPTCLFLIGFSGSGKSTIGPPLARRFKAEFFDTDAMIEKKAGCSISKLFSRDGEAHFRDMERQAIDVVLRSKARRKVIALGGGAFANRKTRALITAAGIVVYLSCPIRELYRRLRLKSDRPLLNVRPKAGETMRQARLRKINSLLSKRARTYNLANLRLATANKTIAACVTDLYRKVRKLNAPA